MRDILKRQQVLENLIYGVIWIVLFITPFGDYIYNQNNSVKWDDVFLMWERMLPFFLIFLINNFVFVPQLLIKKKSWLYLLSILLTILIFVGFTTQGRMTPHNKVPELNKEWNSRPPTSPDHSMAPPAPHDMPSGNINPESRSNPENDLGLENNSNPENNLNFRNSPNPGNDRPYPHKDLFLHMPFIGPFLNNFIIAILIVGFNIAIKLLFQSIRDEHQLKELEKHNLETELAYLKHQINPHFFMNTLNNIHALIDIDTEKAKDTVIELSKMMRYVLYDSSQETISLEKEILFIKNYIELMKLRYTNKVNIKLFLPEVIPSVKIPPLLFISFLENAFKHGISYQKDSYINFSLQIDEREIECLVTNSNFEKESGQQGIGLENVRKRLNLLYKENYTLKIDSTEEEFSVLLIIPLL